MDLYRQVGQSLHEGADELARGAGRKDAGHVLYAERVDPHRDLLLRKRDIGGDCVDWRGCIAYRSLRVAAVFLDTLDGLLEIAGIV